MRYFKVELGGIEQWLWSNLGMIGPHHKTFTQQPGHWTLFLFEHDGTMVVNNKPIPFAVGNIGFIVPGTKVEFEKSGDDTLHYSFTFGLMARKETVAIPAVADVGDLAEVRRAEFQSSVDWLHASIMRGLACVFNTLWTIAEPQHMFRKSDLVFDAEELIVQRLSQKIVIADMARELGISHAHLLRLFRDEHNCTIEQFVREKRAEIARQLITRTQLSLKEVAVKTGMPDLQYFNKVVRTSTGLSPRALREQSLNRTRH